MRKIGLNLGAGNLPYGDTADIYWLNLEPYYTHGHPEFETRVVGNHNILPIKMQDIDKYFAGDSIDIIHIVHALEHVTYIDSIKILQKCFKLLKQNVGVLEVETPDLDKACALWLAGAQTPRVLGLFYGDDHENEGQLHKTGFNFKRYEQTLTEFGFKSVEEIPVGEGHGAAEDNYDIRVRAIK